MDSLSATTLEELPEFTVTNKAGIMMDYRAACSYRAAINQPSGCDIGKDSLAFVTNMTEKAEKLIERSMNNHGCM